MIIDIRRPTTTLTAQQARAHGIVCAFAGAGRLWRHRAATDPALLHAFHAGYDETLRATAQQRAARASLLRRVQPLPAGDPLTVLCKGQVRVLLPSEG